MLDGADYAGDGGTPARPGGRGGWALATVFPFARRALGLARAGNPFSIEMLTTVAALILRTARIEHGGPWRPQRPAPC
jgi:hypothetical protein